MQPAVLAVDLSSPRRRQVDSVVGRADDSAVGDRQVEEEHHHYLAVGLLAYNRNPEEPWGAE